MFEEIISDNSPAIFSRKLRKIAYFMCVLVIIPLNYQSKEAFSEDNTTSRPPRANQIQQPVQQPVVTTQPRNNANQRTANISNQNSSNQQELPKDQYDTQNNNQPSTGSAISRANRSLYSTDSAVFMEANSYDYPGGDLCRPVLPAIRLNADIILPNEQQIKECLLLEEKSLRHIQRLVNAQVILKETMFICINSELNANRQNDQGFAGVSGYNNLSLLDCLAYSTINKIKSEEEVALQGENSGYVLFYSEQKIDVFIKLSQDAYNDIPYILRQGYSIDDFKSDIAGYRTLIKANTPK